MDSQPSRVLGQRRGLVRKGAFDPGERLAQIPLAEKLGASRTPVRQGDALARSQAASADQLPYQALKRAHCASV